MNRLLLTLAGGTVVVLIGCGPAGDSSSGTGGADDHESVTSVRPPATTTMPDGSRVASCESVPDAPSSSLAPGNEPSAPNGAPPPESFDAVIESVAMDPDGAGVYLDSTARTFVALFVSADENRDAKLATLAEPWHFRSQMVDYTYAELESAADAAREVLIHDGRLFEIGVDVRRNRVLIRIGNPEAGLGTVEEQLPQPIKMFCLDEQPATDEAPAASD